ncbi:MAG: S41 family peptidase [Gammaproteobacteria bacterium]|nr:S41 family peptidase [Gammaproteobacteria bacterium]
MIFSRFTMRFISTFSLAAVLTTTAFSLSAQERGQPQALPLPLNEVRMFTEALDRIRKSYVEPVDDQTLLEDAIRGMLGGLDPHSAYMAGSDYDNLQETTSGEFGGLGVEVGQENGYIRIISPIDDTPADRAGIQAGDLIIQIDGQPLREILPEEAAKMMRGKPGTDVTITVVREGLPAPFDVTITREIIAVASVRHRSLEPGYGYIRVSQFKMNTGEEVVKAIASLREENPQLKGLVMDLRNNPGGVLPASVAVVDAFISEGKIVFTKGRLPENNMEFEATRSNPGLDTPLVVLINEGSASASEIVAGALQDHGRAIIMGKTSFGKGSVQTVLPLGENRAIKLTTSLYYTPSGRSIQAQGIVPDIEVDEALVTKIDPNSVTFSEADLQGHLENTTGTQSQSVQPITSMEQILVNDYPLNEALNLLKGINALGMTRVPASYSQTADLDQ